MRHISLFSLINRRQRRKQAVFKSLRKRAGRFLLGCASVSLLFLVISLFAVGLVYTGLVRNLPSLDTLPLMLDPETGLLMQPTRIYDRTGKIVLKSLENPGVPRRYLSLDPNQADHFSPELIRAVVGYFDRDFWRGPGFSISSITSPIAVTIPERLVSDLLLWQEKPGLARTVRMRLLAAQVISRYGHVQVLEWYLNSAYFGHLAYGGDSAARLYLGKPATSMDLVEASILVASIQAPALNPLDAPTVAFNLQQGVLQKLVENGVITDEEYLKAATILLDRVQNGVDRNEIVEKDDDFAVAFIQQVIDRVSYQISQERLERGGLKVITTLDYNLQVELACLARAQLARLVNSPKTTPDEFLLPDGSFCQSVRLLPALLTGQEEYPGNIQTSAVVFDPITGQVLAMIGDTGPEGKEGLLLTHQPGSLLTPFAAVAGFARGGGPASLVWDIPSSMPASMAEFQNPDSTFHGPVRLRMALANDYLAPIAQMIEQIGAPNVWRLTSAFGLSSVLEENSAELIFKGGQVSPLELAQAYAVFASQGNRTGQRLSSDGEILPGMVLFVEDLNGLMLIDAHLPESQAAVSPQLSYLVHHILSDNIARWPSLGHPNPLEIGRPAGGKVGQVDGNTQVWAAGYTPHRVAVFWLGVQGESEQQIDPKLVAGLWYALMQYSNQTLPAQDWSEPVGIVKLDVCDPSGQLPTVDCPEIVSEVFLSGSEPAVLDNLYQEFQINRETGRLATVFTPPALVEEKVFMLVPESARTWALAAGLLLPPQEYDAIQPPEPSLNTNIASPSGFSYVRGEVTVEGTAAGDDFHFFQLLVGKGINPQTWLQIGQDGTSPVSDGVLGSWDTSGQDGLFAVRLLVARQDQAVETATIQVTVDNTPPLVRIPYPISEQEILASSGQKITFQADVTDSIAVSNVVWLVDGFVLGESFTEPFVYSWSSSAGEHVLEVRAYDLAGNLGKSEEVHFTVVNN